MKRNVFRGDVLFIAGMLLASIAWGQYTRTDPSAGATPPDPKMRPGQFIAIAAEQVSNATGPRRPDLVGTEHIRGGNDYRPPLQYYASALGSNPERTD